MKVRIPESFVPRHLFPRSLLIVPLFPAPPASPKYLYLDPSTAKSNAKTYLQRTPRCKPINILD